MDFAMAEGSRVGSPLKVGALVGLNTGAMVSVGLVFTVGIEVALGAGTLGDRVGAPWEGGATGGGGPEGTGGDCAVGTGAVGAGGVWGAETGGGLIIGVEGIDGAGAPVDLKTGAMVSVGLILAVGVAVALGT
jgi:hypothetical protein